MAAASGRPVNIPVVVRSLSRDVISSGFDPHTGLVPDLEMATYLDIVLRGGGGKEMNVNSFHLSWWYDSMTTTETPQLLSFETIRPALEHHKRQIRTSADTRLADFAAKFNKPTYSWHSEAHLNTKNPCTRCRLYRAVAFGAYDKLCDLRNLVHASETAEQTERVMTSRCAAGFNVLYEVAVIKEASGAAGKGSDSEPKNRSTVQKRGRRKRRYRKMIVRTNGCGV